MDDINSFQVLGYMYVILARTEQDLTPITLMDIKDCFCEICQLSLPSACLPKASRGCHKDRLWKSVLPYLCYYGAASLMEKFLFFSNG